MYKFDPRGASVADSFRAVALSQLDDALADLDAPDASDEQRVHEGRRRCKKLRGLLQLVRPAFPRFAEENAALRQAASTLSHLRDADVLSHTVAHLGETEGADRERLQRIVERLRDEPAVGEKAADRIAAFRQSLAAVRDRAVSWTLQGGAEGAMLEGLKASYAKARRRMERALRSRHPSDFHEWRKATKAHGFHIDLLRKSAPDVLPDDLRVVEELATLLGEHHDLAVLSDALRSAPLRFGDGADRQALAAAIAPRSGQIEHRVKDLGRQVFAERPRALHGRFARYWRDASD